MGASFRGVQPAAKAFGKAAMAKYSKISGEEILAESWQDYAQKLIKIGA